jgi:hypothetical protein
MTKSQKRALRFAYRLMRGDFNEQLLTFTSGNWIEPDRDISRPYLDESVFTELLMRGYLECQMVERERTVYLYKITPEGCAAMGRSYPLNKNLRSRSTQHPLFNPRGRHVPYPPRRHPPVFGERRMRAIRRTSYTSQKMA